MSQQERPIINIRYDLPNLRIYFDRESGDFIELSLIDGCNLTEEELKDLSEPDVHGTYKYWLKATLAYPNAQPNTLYIKIVGGEWRANYNFQWFCQDLASRIHGAVDILSALFTPEPACRVEYVTVSQPENREVSLPDFVWPVKLRYKDDCKPALAVSLNAFHTTGFTASKRHVDRTLNEPAPE